MKPIPHDKPLLQHRIKEQNVDNERNFSYLENIHKVGRYKAKQRDKATANKTLSSIKQAVPS